MQRAINTFSASKKRSHWHGPQQLVRVSLRDGSRIGPIKHFAEGMRKRVYFGNAFFRQEKNGVSRIVRKPAVIKTFKNPLTDSQAGAYNDLIRFLYHHKYPIPKGSLIKATPEISTALRGIVAPGEWIAIQQFFGRRGVSHIIDRGTEVDRVMKKLAVRGKDLSKYTEVSMLFLGKKLARNDAAVVLARLADLGISPKFDVAAPMRSVVQGKNGQKQTQIRGVIPFDLDLLVEEILETKSKPPSEKVAVKLLETLKLFSPSQRERERLFRIALATVKSPQLKENLLYFKKSQLVDDIETLEYHST